MTTLQERFLNNKFSANQPAKQEYYIYPLTIDSMNPDQKIESVKVPNVSRQKFIFFPEDYEKNNIQNNFYRASNGLPVFNPSNVQYNNPPVRTEPKNPVVPQSLLSKPLPRMVPFASS